MRAPTRPRAAPDHPTLFLWVVGNHWDVLPTSEGLGATLGTLSTPQRQPRGQRDVMGGTGSGPAQEPKSEKKSEILKNDQKTTGPEPVPPASHKPGEPSPTPPESAHIATMTVCGSSSEIRSSSVPSWGPAGAPGRIAPCRLGGPCLHYELHCAQ